jgi:biopolymer transport protein ExbB
MMKSRFFLFVFLLATGLPQLAHAWWNEAWTGRRTIVIDTSTTGVEIAAPVASAVLPVRLHSGNYDFLAGQPGGADIRVLAGDDKTPLKVGVEHFDPASELGVLWVQVPQIAPKTAGQKLYLYFGNAGVQAEVAAPLFDGATAAVFQFRSEDERPQDVSGKGNHAQAPLAVEKAGLLGASGRFEGASLRLPAASTLALTAGAGFTFSTWVKPAATGPRALLYRQGPLSVVIAGGMLTVEGTSGSPIRGGTLATDTWQHVAVTVGAGETALFINGMRVAAGPGNLPAVQGEVVIGDGLIGLLDEVQLASTRRPAEWIKLAAAAGGADGLLLKLVEDGAQETGGGHSYIGILVDNLTTDAWVVIVILVFMFAAALAVMAAKARMIGVVDKANRGFLRQFRQAEAADLLALDAHAADPKSSLFRLYQAGVREAKKRADASGAISLSGASVDAVKAAVDADMVRETHKLNAKMVILTIAISGGPFLGLLGTVVGVMITFAAIAAAGDVNVNAIAPGIAAALLATVAGLAVAIPALFGYNYLASRIKNISADMQIFVDEFITRIAENYGR